MDSLTSDQANPRFAPFARLPTELRLKIWNQVLADTPPQLLTFALCNSDLDYLRLNRRSCHDNYHICARKSKAIPSILHACQESRSVGLQQYSVGFFDTTGKRTLSLSREDTDIEAYTTCSHEVGINEQEGIQRGIYYNPKKDVVFLSSSNDSKIDWAAQAYVWGGQTGIKFGKMGIVAMSYEILINCGIGHTVVWDSIDRLLVYSEQVSIEQMRGLGTNWSWKNENTDGSGFVRKMLTARGLFASDGSEVDVKYQFNTIEEAMDFLAAEE